jgi:hypothetical protein
MDEARSPVAGSTPSASRWLGWLGVSWLLIPLGFLPCLVLGFILYDDNSESSTGLLFTLLFPLLIASTSAAVQAQVLRPVRHISSAWIGASGFAAAGGAGLGLIVGTTTVNSLYHLENLLGIAISGALTYWGIYCGAIGSAIGISQWLLLRHQLIHAYRWLLMTILVWEVWGWILYGLDCGQAAYKCS